MSLVLYDFHGSPCARRVCAVLLEKGLDWETGVVDAEAPRVSRAQIARVYDGTVVSEDEAQHRGSLLGQRLDRLEAALRDHPYLVADAYTIADLSVGRPADPCGTPCVPCSLAGPAGRAFAVCAERDSAAG